MTDQPVVIRKIKRADLIVIILIGAVYVLPILVDLLTQGWSKVFSFFAADTFYYLVVARNFSGTGTFSFDGEYPTNGFHPLWQVILSVYYRLAGELGLPDPLILVGVLIISMIFILVGLIFFAQAFRTAYGEITPWLLLLPVGVYAVLLAPFEPRFGSLWSFSNGMETAPLIFFFGLLMWKWQQGTLIDSRFSAIKTGLVLSLLIFSRLDHFMFVAAVFLGLAVRLLFERRGLNTWLNLGISILTCALFLAGYLGANFITTGMLLPVSGSIKSTFPSPLAGKMKLDEIPAVMATFGQPEFGANVWRYAQMFLPVLLSIVVIAVLWRRTLREWLSTMQEFWLISAAGVILLGLYNFLYVPTLDQGHWYFPISILFMSLVGIDWLGHLTKKNVRNIVLVSLVLFDLVFYFGVYHNASRNQRFADFYNHRDEVQAFYTTPPKIIEYDDGIISYATGFPALSGFGFCLDREAAEALKNGELLDLAYERGYRHIASYYYFGSRFSLQSTPDEIKASLQSIAYFLGQHSLDGYRFELDYQSPQRDFSIILFDKEAE